ncbi:uncharacterized protein LOC105443437 isoform X1 [Strongylocentrotus purpuratus]|uniref:Uncharacterized protein n=1 Tax=Strongylocentrotus purpuratus TaxID=7668 RepID=A0A7M7STG9_STRPU|nr:uncharacterized protein LOC105443437 isoform X1 [Strongylocentrotus purpuratus]
MLSIPYAGVVTKSKECFCGLIFDVGSNSSCLYYGPRTSCCASSCLENRVFSCGNLGELTVFDLLPGPDNSVTPREQQTTEKSTSVMAISTNHAGQQSTITQHESTPPFITGKGVTAAVLGTLCGILLIYSVIVSLLLYLSRRTRRSSKNSKEPTAAKQKPYTGLDRTNPERHSYQGIYLSPNGEGDQCPNSFQTHSYQEIVTPCSSYRNDAVGQVRGRQAAQEARRSAPDDPGDMHYVIPEL